MENEKCEQGVVVYVRGNGLVLMRSLSRLSNGLLGGHGKFRKLQINGSDEILGAAFRACLEDRKPGVYVPHMFREKEAYQAMMKAYLEDREVVSDKVFYKGTKSFVASEYRDRIEFLAANNSSPNAVPAVPGGPHAITVPSASDVELGQAIRRTLEFCAV